MGDQQAALETVFSDAAREADSSAPAEKPKRKPGQRGPDKAPRSKPVARVPVAEVANRARPSLFTEVPVSPLPVVFEAPRPIVDDASLRVGVESVVRLLETGASFYVSRLAKQAGVTAAVEAKCVEGTKPTPQVRECIVNGGVDCWKKYFPETPIGPEVVLLGALALWGKQLADIRSELTAIREHLEKTSATPGTEATHATAA